MEENSDKSKLLPRKGEMWHYDHSKYYCYVWPAVKLSGQPGIPSDTVWVSKLGGLAKQSITGLVVDVTTSTVDRLIVILLSSDEQTIGVYQDTFIQVWSRLSESTAAHRLSLEEK